MSETPSGQLGNQGWTTETLLAHVTALLAAERSRSEAIVEANDRRYEQRFQDTKTAVDAALSAAKEAVIKAEEAANKRFEGVNEFRGTLADQQRTLMPRAESEALHRATNERLTRIEKAGVGEAGQHLGMKSGYAWAIGTVAVIVTVLAAVSAISVFLNRGAP